ncbi:RNA polymerase sigma-70 factor [soil metagenome]
MLPKNFLDEKKLIELLATGDETAFTRLFEKYRNKVYTIALRLTHSNIIAEEIVRDVFLKIWLKRNDLLQVRSFDAYLFVITRNKVYKVLKQMATNYQLVAIADEYVFPSNTDPSQQLLDKEYTEILQTAIARLPMQQQKVYHLLKARGLKREEVARQLSIGPETVKFHLAQAMKNIRAFCLLHLSAFATSLLLLERFISLP